MAHRLASGHSLICLGRSITFAQREGPPWQSVELAAEILSPEDKKFIPGARISRHTVSTRVGVPQERFIELILEVAKVGKTT